jgi:hypothetical protein
MALLNQTQQEYYNGSDHGGYQFVSLNDIINQFEVAYVGEEKIIQKVKRTDIAFHAQRAVQELSFDTFKSYKAQEITVPASLQMTLPQDYVNYTKVSWVDSAGIKHLLYPTSKTSNPTPILQNSDGDYSLTAKGTFLVGPNPTIVLDGEYLDIKVGMFVTGASLNGSLHPNNWDTYLVSSTSNLNGVTSITIALAVLGTTSLDTPIVIGGGILSTSTATETLTFTNQDRSLILERETTYVLENAILTASSNKITASTATDVTNIKVGMLVSHIDIPTDTVVQDVDSASGVITLVRPNFAGMTSITAAVLVGAAREVTFLSIIQNSTTWSSYKSGTPSENQDDYQDDTYWPMEGSRYGLDPQHAQANGSFYIDQNSGKIHFSSNISGKTVILDYISDGLGTDEEMIVHKFAEEAMYKWIAHAILSTKIGVPEYVISRFKKERFAAIRTAKLRLSNLKIEELAQTLRGKSKWIKH